MINDANENQAIADDLEGGEMRLSLEKDKASRIGSTHGDSTEADERNGYARDIGPYNESEGSAREARTSGSGLTGYARKHPSRNLQARRQGFGIGGGYERPYRKDKPNLGDSDKELYGPLPHSGYYGTGIEGRPFKRGQAGFSEELSWYRSQYGEKTTDYKSEK